MKLPAISSSGEIAKAMIDHEGASAMVEVTLRYNDVKPQVDYRIWLKPGWQQSFVWRTAADWIKESAGMLFNDASEVKDVRFVCFKLV